MNISPQKQEKGIQTSIDLKRQNQNYLGQLYPYFCTAYPSLQLTNFPSFSLYCSRRGKHSNLGSFCIQTLQPVCIIQSIVQFFKSFLSLKSPSSLLIDSKIMLFYSQCKPFWQDWINSGCLLIQFKNKQEEEIVLDKIWEYLSYCFIGGNIDEDVIGLIVCKREKITLLQIWLRKNDRAKYIGTKLQEEICKELPKNIGVNINKLFKVKHKKHSDSITSNSTIKGAQNLTQINMKKSNHLNNSF